MLERIYIHKDQPGWHEKQEGVCAGYEQHFHMRSRPIVVYVKSPSRVQRIDVVTSTDKLRELEATATPAPWRWAGSVTRPMITTTDRGMVYVMGFVRSGMQGAQPTFQKYDPGFGRWGNGRMVPASTLAVREVPYRDDIVDIDHPDARLLIALRNAAPLLLEVERTGRIYRDLVMAGASESDQLEAWAWFDDALKAVAGLA